jgi:serine/threonine protein kinase
MPNLFNRDDVVTVTTGTELGRGATATVYVATVKKGTAAGATYAVKISAGTNEAEAQFATETTILDLLQTKPAGYPADKERPTSIIQYYGNTVINGKTHIFLENFQGEVLKNKFDELALPNNFQKRLNVVRGLQEAFTYLIAHNVKHFDQSTQNENMLVNSNGDVRVIDFGLAGVKSQKEVISSVHAMIKSIYMAMGFLESEATLSKAPKVTPKA